MPGLLDAVKAWLRSQHHIHVPEDWLEACAEWIQSEQGNPSPGQLRQAIYEQWLLSDLRELAHSSLPEGLASEQKYMLEGRYSLQVDSCRDVGQASYSQLKKMQGQENENAKINANTQYTQQPWEVKSSRMLMMALTDGVQDVQGMEYQTIRQIHENLAPGTKLTVHGPVLCRLGVLMLSEKNVRVLGGEVEAMAEDNCLKTVLARTLSLDPDNLPVNLRNKTPVDALTQSSSIRGAPPANVCQQPNPRQNSSTQPSANVRPTSTNQRQAASRVATTKTDEEDETGVFEDIDADMLADHWGDDDDMDAVMSQINVPPITTTTTTTRAVTSSTSTSSTNVGTTSRGATERRSVTGTIRQSGTAGTIRQSGTAGTIRQSTKTATGREDAAPTAMNTSSTTKDSSCSDMDCQFPDDDDDFNLCEVADVVNEPVSNRDIGNRSGRDHVMDAASTSRQSTVDTSTDYGHLDVDFLSDDEDFLPLMPPEAKRSRLDDDRGRTLAERIDDLMSRRETLKRTDRPLALSSEPYIYLRQVLAMLPVNVETTVHVKAYVSTVVRKLDHNKGRHWSLGLKINDGTASLDVRMNDDVIAGMMSLTADAAYGMRRQGMKDPDMRNNLQQTISEFQRKLINLSCIFVLTLGSGSEQPRIVELVEFTEMHAEKLYERLMKNVT